MRLSYIGVLRKELRLSWCLLQRSTFGILPFLRQLWRNSLLTLDRNLPHVFSQLSSISHHWLHLFSLAAYDWIVASKGDSFYFYPSHPTNDRNRWSGGSNLSWPEYTLKFHQSTQKARQFECLKSRDQRRLILLTTIEILTIINGITAKWTVMRPILATFSLISYLGRTTHEIVRGRDTLR